MSRKPFPPSAGTAPSTGAIPFEKHRFRSTAGYYERFRTPYPRALIDWVERRAALTATDRVLDLGCGPGTLAIPFGRLCAEVVAVDPEPAMLDAAGAAAAREGVSTLTLVEGSSQDLSAVEGPFRLVTMGRSFHWMDRAATLAALDGLLEPGGAVVLFGDAKVHDDGWRAVFDRVCEAYAGEGPTSRRVRRSPGWLPHESILAASPFPCMERHGIVVAETLTADDIVGRAFSMSSTAPEKLGDRREAFEGELRRELASLSPEGPYAGLVEPFALLAERADGAMQGHV